METVRQGMQVATLAGPIGVVSTVEGDRITVQRENGETIVLEASDYTLENGIVRLRHGAASSSSSAVRSTETVTGGVADQGGVQSSSASETSVIDQLREGTFEMRARSEELVVTKVARVVEEIVLRKDAEERTEVVNDIVRRTEVDVQPFFDEAGASAIDSGSRGSSDATLGIGHEGSIERHASQLGNTVERGRGLDLDRDGDVGQRDPRNNI